MPIKRSRYKRPFRQNKDKALDDLVLFFSKGEFKSRGFSLEPKRRIPLSKSQQQEINDIEMSIHNHFIRVPKKKKPSNNNPNYWTIMVKYLPKDLISKAVKCRRKWKSGFKKALDERHEGFYKKN